MPTQALLKRRKTLISISEGLGLKTVTGETPTSESQLLTVLIDAFQGYGNDWPHKMLQMIDKRKVQETERKSFVEYS